MTDRVCQWCKGQDDKCRFCKGVKESKMNECQISGCRYLQTTCLTCGRLVIEKILPKESGWIKCLERIPQEWGHVLVFDKDQGICRGYWAYDPTSWQHYPLGSYAGDGCLFHVSHWRELPPPPLETT